MKKLKVFKFVFVSFAIIGTLFSFGGGLTKLDTPAKALSSSISYKEKDFEIVLNNYALRKGKIYQLYDNDASTDVFFMTTSNNQDDERSITYVYDNEIIVRNITVLMGSATSTNYFDGSIQYLSSDGDWINVGDNLCAENKDVIFYPKNEIKTKQIRVLNTANAELGVDVAFKEISINQIYKASVDDNYKIYQGTYFDLLDKSNTSFIWFQPVDDNISALSIVFDLYDIKKLNYFMLYTGDPSDDTDALGDVTFSYSDSIDGEFMTLGNATFSGGHGDFKYSIDSSINARYIKISGTRSGWVKVAKFEVGYQHLKLSPCLSLYQADRSNFSFISFGTDQLEDTLLDINTDRVKDENVNQGYLIFDIDEIKDVSSIYVSTGGGSAYGDYYFDLLLSYSSDGVNYILLDKENYKIVEYTNKVDYYIVFETSISARYIKIYNLSSSSWVTISEISINADYNFPLFIKNIVCADFINDPAIMVRKIENLYNDLTLKGISDFNSDETLIHNVEYIKYYALRNSSVNKSNGLNLRSDLTTKFVYIPIICAVLGLALLGYIYFKRKKNLIN